MLLAQKDIDVIQSAFLLTIMKKHYAQQSDKLYKVNKASSGVAIYNKECTVCVM